MCQPECTPEEEKALEEQREKEGLTDAGFDKTINGLRLRPLQFISQRNSQAEKSYHSSVGEMSTGRWAFQKWRKHLWHGHFTWITDCSGIIRFWEFDLVPTHQCQRWKMDVLRFDFTALHRPEHMPCECNLLSRYNGRADLLRANTAKATKAQDARIEHKLKTGVSPNKGVRKLAAHTSVTATFLALPRVQVKDSPFTATFTAFEHSLKSYGCKPKFSNQTVCCVGDTVDRSFLAEICDNDRMMGTLTPSGISLITVAKQKLRMPWPLSVQGAGKEHWMLKTSNLPGPTKFRKMIDTSDSTCSTKETDWMWIGAETIPDDAEEVEPTMHALVVSRCSK